MSAPWPSFDETALVAFWDFIAARQRAWYLRTVERRPPPWSDDPIVRVHHFTNVYRELDPGTQYAARRITTAEEPEGTRIFNIVFYRLFGHEPTWEALYEAFGSALPAPEVGVGAKVAAVLAKLPRAFTPAYMVHNMGRREPKAVVMGDLMEAAARTWSHVLHRLASAETREHAYRALAGITGVGPFVAFQSLVDLCYPVLPGYRSVLPWSNNDFAVCGPGARRGLLRLFPRARPPEENGLLQWLGTRQKHELDKRGFIWLEDWSGALLRLSRANLQNCCCEFDKYYRIRTSSRRNTGRRRNFDERAAARRDAETGGPGMPVAGLPLAVQVQLPL